MFGRRKIATLVAEFLGTGILTLLVLSVQRSSIGVPFFVAIAAGLTVAVMVFAVGSLSGAHLNPAITIGMWTARKVSTLTGILYIIVQFLGAWVAYWLYTYFANSTLPQVGGHFAWRIFVAELVGTAIFAFGWAGAVYQRFTAGLTSTVVGISYIIGILAASTAAIGLLNPALALGIRAWVWGTYVAGPVVGAIVGIQIYNLIFAPALVAAPARAAVAAGRPAAAPVKTTTRKTTARKTSTRSTTRRRK